jgi:hypothetical protein
MRPIEYLLIGHVTQDITDEGVRLGGTVSYAGLTAQAFGKTVGVLTAASPQADLSALSELEIQRIGSRESSVFENIYSPEGRQQKLHARAADLTEETLPVNWRKVEILHLAPVTNEILGPFVDIVTHQNQCITPQGWLRAWDDDGYIRLRSWEALSPYLTPDSIVVLSQEDLGGSLEHVEEIAEGCKLLVVTLGAEGVIVHYSGEQRHLPAPQVTEIDPTGCGDIFAATFFVCLQDGDNPWMAAQIANQVAARGATRIALKSVPTSEEVKQALQLRDK